jgi:hypothetical protein
MTLLGSSQLVTELFGSCFICVLSQTLLPGVTRLDSFLALFLTTITGLYAHSCTFEICKTKTVVFYHIGTDMILPLAWQRTCRRKLMDTYLTKPPIPLPSHALPTLLKASRKCPMTLKMTWYNIKWCFMTWHEMKVNDMKWHSLTQPPKMDTLWRPKAQ